MIEPHWKRIAGIDSQEDGTIGAVWLAHDTTSDYLHIYDSCVFKREVWAVIAEGMNARGRMIPIAWKKKDKDMSDTLKEKGCRVIFEPTKDTDEEVLSREIWERMRTGRLTVDKRLGDWRGEFQTFRRDKNKIPEGFPLMAATRHAIAMLRYAKRLDRAKNKIKHRRQAAIV